MICFELMLKRLEKIRFRLGQMYRTDKALRDRLLSAVEGVPECTQACLIAAPTSDGLAAQLRQSIATAGKVTGKTFNNSINQSYPINGLTNQFYIDRRYHNNVGRFRNQPSYQTTINTKPKKCWDESEA
ncbi:hypothetical protein HI914_01206 [Erysiphe necator]|nr:hypothetical protein HI914_05550 [Erysiphe necator]KAI6246794.1 hypothetical protein HI914_04776 [Erysiphe necator]KAI6246870.1 hypothetical protein HI914_05010 [Erysiphe necator]KAI6250145.1 hypothetical protein HI914_02106 [Erysiphe necator]KAI6250466.1 hypothetical protein HI914_01206 [Erysiphe necator]